MTDDLLSLLLISLVQVLEKLVIKVLTTLLYSRETMLIFLDIETVTMAKIFSHLFDSTNSHIVYYVYLKNQIYVY